MEKGFQNQNKIPKSAATVLGADGGLGSGSCHKARWGRCINFQNQIKILKGPNSFWGLMGLVSGSKNPEMIKQVWGCDVHKLPESNKNP